MSALLNLKFEPHNGFGDNDPDGNPWPLGFISTGRMKFPIFELQVVIEHPKMVDITKAMAAAPAMLAAGQRVLDYATLAEMLADPKRHDDCAFGIRLGDLRALAAAIAKAEGRADA